MADNTTQANSSLYEARALVRDLMTPDPRIYWLDFLFHIVLGWMAFCCRTSYILVVHLADIVLLRGCVWQHLSCCDFHS
ncbi:MAG: hypothetical protein P0107_00065 [Nitrosomonas sp.]|nr:hypothetical protein [Nitrosomonas sp.]